MRIDSRLILFPIHKQYKTLPYNTLISSKTLIYPTQKQRCSSTPQRCFLCNN